MSDDPAAWLQQLRENIRADPQMAPGAVVMRSGIDQAIMVSENTGFHARMLVSDLLAEDCRSLIESADYIIRYREAGPAIICECCGTPVAKMPQRCAIDRDAPWKPGIWETEMLRKHTLRRCEGKRVNP